MPAIPNSLKLSIVVALFSILLGSPGWPVGQDSDLSVVPASARAGTAFVIGVGDVLGISVWKEEGLMVSTPVRPDGKVSVPLLGEIEVVGRTPLEVQGQLSKGYERFVTAPAVSLVVTEINSRKVYILGEVADAGVYDIVQPTTLLQALAMAGGFTDFAKKDEVVVLRRDSITERRLVVSVKDITAGKKLEDNIHLIPGDTIFVP